MNRAISRYRKLFGVGPISVTISLCLLALAWLADRSLGHISIADRPSLVRVPAWILLALEICWHSWCSMTLRKWWFEDQLCTTGPYQYVRHPIYAGWLFLGFTGLILMFNSWIMLPLPLILYPLISMLVRSEEKMMTGVFGEQYARYAARTGRFFPRLLG